MPEKLRAWKSRSSLIHRAIPAKAGPQAAEEDFPLEELPDEDELLEEEEPESPELDPEPELDAAGAAVFAPESDFDGTVAVLFVLRLSLR